MDNTVAPYWGITLTTTQADKMKFEIKSCTLNHWKQRFKLKGRIAQFMQYNIVNVTQYMLMNNPRSHSEFVLLLA